MDKMKQWVALAVVGALAILAGGWFLLVSPKRADAQALKDETATQDRANAMLVTQLAQLKAQAKDLPAQQAKLAAIAAKIPGNSALPTLVRALNDAAKDTGVELVSMAPATPVDVAAPAPAAATPSDAAAAAAKNGSAADKQAASAAARTAAGAAAVGRLQSIGVTLNVVGSYFQVAEYLDRLENLTRAFRVTAFNLGQGLNPVKKADAQPKLDTGKVLTASITGLVYQTTGGTTASLATVK